MFSGKGMMAGLAEEGGLSERMIRLNSARGGVENEVNRHIVPVGAVERAEVLLVSKFLYKPFESFSTWKRLMEAHGFAIFVNFETVQRNTERTRWSVEVQVYITEKKPDKTGELENIFIRTLLLESAEPLPADLAPFKLGNIRKNRRYNR